MDEGRAAREALSRPLLGTPRAGGDGHGLSVLLAARSSAVDAATIAQRQLFSLVIAAPDHLREKLRGKKLPEMVPPACGFSPDVAPRPPPPRPSVPARPRASPRVRGVGPGRGRPPEGVRSLATDVL